MMNFGGICRGIIRMVVIGFAVALSVVSAAQPTNQAVNADVLVTELRDLPPHLEAGPISVLCSDSDPSSCARRAPSATETKRRLIYDQLYALGIKGVPALARALTSSDVNLRRNVVLALDVLGGGSYFVDRRPPRIDISAALPALVAALKDSDTTVRGWAAEDIGNLGGPSCKCSATADSFAGFK